MCDSPSLSPSSHSSKTAEQHVLQQQQRAAMVRRLREELGPTVDAQLQKGGEEGLTDATLLRWLVARKWVYAEAKRDLAAHAEWRAKYMPRGGRILEDDPYVKENVAENKVFMQGLDTLGHPVLVCYGNRHLPKSLESSTRWVCYILDAIDRMGRNVQGWDGKGVGVMCLTGLTMKNADLNAGRALFPSLQAHFPERLYKLVLYDAPCIFLWLWKLTQPFLDPVTARKVMFVYPKQGSKELFDLVPRELLPPDLGGTGTLRPIQDAWRLILDGNTDAFLAHQGRKATAAAEAEAVAAAGVAAVAAGAAGVAAAAAIAKAEAVAGVAANAAVGTGAAAAAAGTAAAVAAAAAGAAAAASAAAGAAAAMHADFTGEGYSQHWAARKSERQAAERAGGAGGGPSRFSDSNAHGYVSSSKHLESLAALAGFSEPGNRHSADMGVLVGEVGAAGANDVKGQAGQQL